MVAAEVLAAKNSAAEIAFAKAEVALSQSNVALAASAITLTQAQAIFVAASDAAPPTATPGPGPKTPEQVLKQIKSDSSIFL